MGDHAAIGTLPSVPAPRVTLSDQYICPIKKKTQSDQAHVLQNHHEHHDHDHGDDVKHEQDDHNCNCNLQWYDSA